MNNLKLISPLILLGDAIAQASCGNIASALQSAGKAGVEIAIKIAADNIESKGQKPDFSKYGLDFINNVALNASVAKSGCRELWQKLLQKALEPQLKDEIEIRVSDVELMAKLNPTDVVLILGVDAVNAKNFNVWKSDSVYKEIRSTDRRWTSTGDLYERLEEMVPLKFIVDHASMVVGGNFCISDKNILYALRDNKDSASELYKIINIYESFSSQIISDIESLYKDDRRMTRSAYDNIQEIRLINVPVLVNYKITNNAQRINDIIK